MPAALAKSGASRTVPISRRLKAILELRRLDPDGEALPASTFAFGNEVGERVASVKKAWGTACREAKIAGLRLHDLRREAASRFLEVPGASLHDARALLGYADITTTSRYLASSIDRLKRLARALESDRRSIEAEERNRLQRADPEQPTVN